MKLERYIELEQKWIINWCWAKWWFSFDRFFENKIKLFNNHKQELFKSLELSIQLKCCWPHDVRFYNWWGLFAFTYANYKFSKSLFYILDWTIMWNRIFAFLITFLWLMIWWISAFNWTFKKKNISIK